MIPVICVDGPSGSGKGTLSQRLSEALGFKLLDSGALYRVVGFAASQQGVAWDDEPAVAAVARSLNVEFIASNLGVRVLYLGSDVTDEVRSVQGAEGASAVAALPSVRDALLSRQRELAVAPGLVADGRDMGYRRFPLRRGLKIFLEASALARARKDDKASCSCKMRIVSLPRLLEAIEARDTRDRNTVSIATCASAGRRRCRQYRHDSGRCV